MPTTLIQYLLLGCILPIHASAFINILSAEPAGTVFSLPGLPDVKYLAAAQPIDARPGKDTHLLSGGAHSLIPASCVWITDALVTRRAIEEQLDLYGRHDDVWNPEFLQHLLIQHVDEQKLDPAVEDWLHSVGIEYSLVARNVEIPRGPILISKLGTTIITGAYSVHAVYRLYLDEYDAFIFGAIPDLVVGGWCSTNITQTFDDGTYSQLIPIPSRFVQSPRLVLPLSQMRFGLKDIYDARGLPTAAGSKAYQLTHPIPSQTAPSVEKLLALGATMVGKTRTSQFAHGANPWEFVDVPYSWNPRGDGHLTASASSSGSACAIAAYDWLDFTVGSDTRGSVRKPASLVGAYGIRPSHGSISLNGVVPLSEEMDTAGFFARRPDLFATVASHWYGDSPVAVHGTWRKLPSRLLYPVEHFPMKNAEAQSVVNRFINTLEQHFGIQKHEVDFSQIVSPFFPNRSFLQFQLSSNKLAEYRSWVDVGRPVTDRYVSLYGQEPEFDPIPERMFNRALNITAEDFEAAVASKGLFKDAMADHVFRYHNASCSDTLFIYDAATGGLPSYRVEEFNHLSGSVPFLLTAGGGADKAAKFSDFFNFLASMGELPEITIPIGQARYYSQISRRWEYIPVAVEIVTRKGCDSMLMTLVEALADMGIIGPVKTGRSMFF